MNLYYNYQYPKTNPLPRAMDVTFYRLLWVTLVAVALTFTVILTSVFVDIDGLLNKQTLPNQNTQSEPKPVSDPKSPKPPEAFEDYQSLSSNEDDDPDNVEPDFRIKRSIESNSLLYHIKSPKVNKILTNHLATLLEELEEEESAHASNAELVNIKIKPKAQISTEKAMQKTENIENMKENDNRMSREIDSPDVLHLAMHNILLQGIIGHMDLNEVYRKVHLLIKSFDGKSDDDLNDTEQIIKAKPIKLIKITPNYIYGEEDKFFNELLKCKKLQEQITQSEVLENGEDSETIKDPPMIIKTVIEITNNNKAKETNANSSKNVKGIIKLLYNGTPIQFEEMNDTKHTQANLNEKYIKNVEEKQHNTENIDATVTTTHIESQNDRNPDLNQAIAKYIRIYTNKLNNNNNNMLNKDISMTKRLKRHVDVNDNRTENSKALNRKPKKNEDELFVEIETHFDGKGTKGDKKKKLVRTLIDTIEKAINTDIKESRKDNSNVYAKPIQIKKRSQKPINNRNVLIVDSLPSAESVEHRQLNSISKTANVIRPLKSVLDMYGETWKKIYNGPGFLTVSKSLNSAEMGELGVDYKSVMKNGIPKRLQKPINTENEIIFAPNENIDRANGTLFFKEIAGSGFTIGINQYVDEPPDKESLKIFTGLENLIQAYHENYGQIEDVASNESEGVTDYEPDNNAHILKTDEERHKRSILNVRLFSNLNLKTKLNKFINTNAMQKKKIFIKSKRNKRHIDQIRIVATDRHPRHSKEDVFLASHEDIFADKAVYKEDGPEVIIGDRENEHLDYVVPYRNPTYEYDTPHLQPYMTNAYDTGSLRTGLMSKYPHVFVENISKSKEEIININSFNRDASGTSKTHEQRRFDSESAIVAEDNEELDETHTYSPNVDEIINAVLPPRSNYKLSVKILPKNNTNMGPGFKELHTSINKSYDKNGVRYVSYINVSEISKVENVSDTKEDVISNTKEPVNGEIQKQRSQIKMLLKLHKAGIDQQLEHLKMESQKLKQIIHKEDKDNAGQNISHVIDLFKELKLKSINERDSILSLFEPKVTHGNYNAISLPMPITTDKAISTTVKHVDPVKLELINTIKRNENITRKVLEKIDQNTNMLQIFLEKLTDKLQSVTKVDVTTEKVTKDSFKYPTDPAINPFMTQIQRNLTNPIPFVYAFQPSIAQTKDTPFENVANVVYHGHIHANGPDDANKYSYKNIAENLKRNNQINDNKNGVKLNDNRFFIDELDNDYKGIMNRNRGASQPVTVRTNATVE